MIWHYILYSVWYRVCRDIWYIVYNDKDPTKQGLGIPFHLGPSNLKAGSLSFFGPRGPSIICRGRAGHRSMRILDSGFKDQYKVDSRNVGVVGSLCLCGLWGP